MAKPVPVEVKSDDCLITVNGEKYAVHEGESVWLVPGRSVGAVHALNRLFNVSTQMAAVAGEPDEVATVTRLADQSYQGVCEALARCIQRWNWTDLLGNPLPQPNGDPSAFNALTPEEIYWLLGAAKGETEAQRKNG